MQHKPMRQNRCTDQHSSTIGARVLQSTSDPSPQKVGVNCDLKRARSAIALGSNLGDSHTILKNAIKTIAFTPGITLLAQSSWYKTIPIGPPQPDYLNGCALLEVRLTPQELLATLLKIEVDFGRHRQECWGPRTLDLDLLLFDDLILDTPSLQLPHPRMTERAFVLMPLVEIAHDWVEPVSRKAIAELVQTLDCSGVRRL